MSHKLYPQTRLFLRGRLRHAMSAEEKATLEGLIESSQRFPDGHVILRRGDLAQDSTLLLEGFIARVIHSGDGRRHIVGFHVPGDFVDLHTFALKRLDHDLVSIGPVEVAFTGHRRIEQLVRDQPHLTRLLWFSTLLDAAIHREWILKLEELKADQRLAHLVAELWHRLNFVELADPHGFNMPVMQADLANACGITAVHINRVIRTLRERGVVELNRGRVSIPNRAALERFATFNSDYLYGSGSLRVGDELNV
ncbi:MAG: Crp/Fnr family transcriptional regulator [Novosphingobium sp.]